MTVGDTAVLAISTPDDEENYYSELANSDLFHVIYLASACTACEEAGIECIHTKLRLPKWKPIAATEKVEKLIQNKVTIARELHGKISSSRDLVFKKPWINQFITRPPHIFQYNPQVIHVAIDPSGGGEGSDYVIGSMAFENSKKVVIYLFTYL